LTFLQIWFSLIVIILLISRQSELLPQLEMLHLNYCPLPCWISIVPGETTIGQAQQLLRSTYPPTEYDHFLNHNPYQGTDWLTITHRRDGTFLMVNFNEWEAAVDQTPGTIVSQITIYNGPADNLTLGDWSILLGKPQALSVTWGNHYASPNVLYYRQGVRLTLNQVDNFVVNSWSIPAGKLTIYDDLFSAYPLSYSVKWHGWSIPYKDKLMALVLP
jgi:hypothetical protein